MKLNKRVFIGLVGLGIVLLTIVLQLLDTWVLNKVNLSTVAYAMYYIGALFIIPSLIGFSNKKITLLYMGGIHIVGAIALIIINATVWKNENYYAVFSSLAIVGIFLLVLALVDAKVLGLKFNTKTISMIAIMSAISTILYIFVKFNLPFFPPFLDIQFSELPALVAGYIYGPLAGCLVILIRCLIKLPLSFTSGVGELADLIIGVILVFTATFIYKKNKSLKGALIGFVIGSAIATVSALLVNWLILIPFYIQFSFNGNEGIIVNMLKYIPGVNESNYMQYYLFVGNLPFNITRYILVGVITFFVYKRTHKLIISMSSD